MRSTLLIAGVLLSACGGGTGSGVGVEPEPGASSGAVGPACDERRLTGFQPDAFTRVLLVKAFRAGEPVALANSPAVPAPPLAPTDMCLVKLLVGPGNPGSPGAPSTSAGIGIEIWLPARWNDVLRTYGSGGWSGGYQADPTRLGGMGAADSTQLAAVGSGYVVSTSDNGHQADNTAGGVGSFAMQEDGSINTVLWRDYSERSIHELALKTKALVAAYYGHPHKYAYWDGYSTGGRQGYKLAQKYPGDYDGILAGAPALNWSRFTSAQLYPQVVMRLENGGPITAAKLNAVSAAANAACGGTALGFLLDPLQCRYDPTRDAAALCSGVAGHGVTGRNDSASTCVNLAEATTINKLWYGPTRDGSHPDPASDNGGAASRDVSHFWWGMARGTSLTITAGETPFSIATDMLALVLQDPSYAQPNFTNATGNGRNRWNTLDYAGLAFAYDLGVSLQPAFSQVNTDAVDLSAFRASGGKLLTYHGLADDYLMPQGTIEYFTRAAPANGGEAELQKFARLFLIPGLAHDANFVRTASIDPATGAPTHLNKVPLPQPASGRDELFSALREWVEHGVAPSRFDLRSQDASVTLPICAWPRKAVYKGSGSIAVAGSYGCD